MAYNDNQTLNFLVRLEQCEKKLDEFLSDFQLLYDEWIRNSISDGVTQDLLDASKYEGTTPTVVTESISGADALLGLMEASGTFDAYWAQLQKFCKNQN